MSVRAWDLEVGDFVDLANDPVFDTDCAGRFCELNTQNAEVAEYELETDAEDPHAAWVHLTFRTEHETYTGAVSMFYDFNDPT